MDRQTLSSYGWILVAVFVFTAMLLFTTPFMDVVLGNIEKVPEAIGESLGVCGHKSTSSKSEYISSDENGHLRAVITSCSDCGREVRRTVDDAPQAHSFNPLYKCSYCGYQHIHEYTIIEYSVYNDIPDNDYYHDVTEDRKCACGSITKSTSRELHSLYKGECVTCGHIIVGG